MMTPEYHHANSNGDYRQSTLNQSTSNGDVRDGRVDAGGKFTVDGPPCTCVFSHLLFFTTLINTPVSPEQETRFDIRETNHLTL